MKMKLSLVAILLQLAVLVYMAADRELVGVLGRTVYLRTLPVDPRDPFRGDYVQLNYEISSLGSALWRDGVKGLSPSIPDRHGSGEIRKVFVGLSVDEEGVAHAEYVTDRRPAEGLFLKGRVEPNWSGRLVVQYGLEAYFVQQGKGLDLERGRTREAGMRVPMEMKTAIRSDGAAVLQGHRWCPLGIALALESSAPPQRPITAKLSLYNASDRPLAVVDLPGGRSFTLEPDAWWRGGNDKDWRWVGESAPPPPAVRDEDVRVLQPGETHTVTVKFDDSNWFVKTASEGPWSLSEQRFGWYSGFRFVYRPPSREACGGLKDANLIWHGRLPSSAFRGGYVD